MEIRVLQATEDGRASELSTMPADVLEPGWVWVDVVVGSDTTDQLLEVSDSLRLDALAVADAAGDHDIPKVDDSAKHSASPATCVP